MDDFSAVTAYLASPSTILDHAAPCCRDAVAWLRGLDTANCRRTGRWDPPAWLRRTYEWGPMRWPLHWCGVPTAERLDCGALAAVATRLFRARSQRAVPVQLVLRYPLHATAQWARMWSHSGEPASWVRGTVVYHEACGVIDGGLLRVWDPTESRWLHPPASHLAPPAFGGVAGVRVWAEDEDDLLAWDHQRLSPGQWVQLDGGATSGDAGIS